MARSRKVPRKVMQAALGPRVDIDSGPLTLERIAAATDVPLAVPLAGIETANTAPRAGGG